MASTSSRTLERAVRRALQPISPFSSFASTSASAIPALSAPPPSTSSSARRVPATSQFHTSARNCSAWPAGVDAEDGMHATMSSSSESVEGGGMVGGSQERRSTRLQQSAPIDRTDAGNSKTRQQLEMPKSRPPKSIPHLMEMKRQGQPIACLTAYDYPSALSLRHADIDICLVGDSMANVALGHSSTQSLTLEATIHHCQAVYRGLFSPLLSISPNTPGAPLLLADVPFGTFQTSEEEGVKSAVRLLKEGGVDGVKIEGGAEILPLVRRLTKFGIPVMGHLGLQPQRVSSSAGYRLQGRTADEAYTILSEALALQEAGAFSIVLECIPNKICEVVSKALRIPTIGIGAGPKADGQILVTNDILGEITSPWHVVAGLAKAGVGEVPALQQPAPPGPKFVRNFVDEVLSGRVQPRSSSGEEDNFASPGPAAEGSAPAAASCGPTGIGAIRMAAIEAYVDAVRERSFPDAEREGYKIKSAELADFMRRAGPLLQG